MLRNSLKRSCSVLMVILFILIPSASYAAPPVYIDGYFEDWVAKPHQGLYYGDYYHPNVKSISLLAYYNKLYGHARTSETDSKYSSNYMYFTLLNSARFKAFDLPCFEFSHCKDKSLNSFWHCLYISKLLSLL